MGKHVHELTGVNAAKTGANRIGFTIEAFPDAVAKVERIVVEQTNATDARWNVELNGQALIGGTPGSGVNVTKANTPQEFQPNAANRSNLITANANDSLNLVVNTGHAPAGPDRGSQLNVSVLTDDGRE